MARPRQLSRAHRLSLAPSRPTSGVGVGVGVALDVVDIRARPRPLRWVLAPALLLATMGRPGLAGAQEPAASSSKASPDAPPPGPNTTAPAKAAKKSGGKKVISLDDDFLVEGKLDKPSAFYILRRSASDYDWARLSVQLAPLVLESVQDPLF